jgi:drug/metabolite transporter (DMT)-like permease
MLMGAVNAVGPAILFNLGFDNLPASINTLIIALGPVFTAITAHYALVGDRFTTRKAIGLLASLAGVALLAGAPTEPGQGQPWLGIVFSLTGALMQGVSAVWVKRMAERYGPASSLRPMMVGAAIVGLVAATIAGHPPLPSAFTPVQWLILITMGSTGLLTFWSLLKANQIARASQAALLGYLIPLIGVIGAVLVLGEPFSVLLLIGGALVMAGLVLVGRNPQKILADRV